MPTTATNRRTSAAVIAAGLLTWATACGTQTASPPRPAAAPAVKAGSAAVRQGSPDSIERRLDALRLSVPQGSPDMLERRLAAAEDAAGCRMSADTAERLGARACHR